MGRRPGLDSATNPLIYRVDSPDRPDIHLLEQVWSADVTGGYTFERFAVSLAAPQYVRPGSGGVAPRPARRPSAGGQYTLFDRRTRPIGIAASAHLTAPTGNAELWLQQQTPSAAINIHASGGSTVIGAATLGYEALGSAELAGTTIGSRALWGLAVHVPVTRSVGTSVEVNGSSYLTDLDKPGANPIEAIASGRLALSEELTLSLGAGTALTRGIGSPALRTLAGLSFVPVAAVPPRKVAPRLAEGYPGCRLHRQPQRVSFASARPMLPESPSWLSSGLKVWRHAPSPTHGIGLLSLPPGEHTLRVTASGYAPFVGKCASSRVSSGTF